MALVKICLKMSKHHDTTVTDKLTSSEQSEIKRVDCFVAVVVRKTHLHLLHFLLLSIHHCHHVFVLIFCQLLPLFISLLLFHFNL